MESTGETNRVHVSGAFADLVNRAQRGAPEYTLLTRDPVEVKGKGRMLTYWLDVPNLEDFRLKRAATLAFVEEMVSVTSESQFMLTSSGTIRIETALPLPGDEGEVGEARHVSLDVETSDGAGPSATTAAAAAAATATDAAAGAATTSASNAAPVDPAPGCGFSYADMTASDFSPLAIEEMHFERICEAILVLFEGMVGSPGCCSVTEPETLKRLVRRVGAAYRAVPYHSFWHAFCVVQQTALLSTLLGLDRDFFTERERFQLMLSALCHDIDHPGHSNRFEVATKSSLALLYNDQSVLENHHLTLAFNIMQHSSYSVFGKWDAESEAQARKFIISAVLATDMDAHALLQDDLLRRRAETDANAALGPAAPAFDRGSDRDRVALAKSVLHAADISNPSRPFHICARISLLAIKEF